MRITSFNFFVFLFLSLVVFYIFPKKYRWFALLGISIFFFVFSSSWKLLLYMIFGIVVSYLGSNIIEKKCKTDKSKKIVLFLTLFLIVGELAILKYINIFPATINLFGSLFNLDIYFNTINLLAPLGISYYTLSLIGYVTDVYRTTSKAQTNILKHALFTCYYPLLISGPVVRYNYMQREFFEEKKLDFNNLFIGFTRLIYGLLKKLVIADQLSQVVNVIFSNYNYYTGWYLVVAVILYAIQIYADFSGCMDIVIGASKMYGVNLPENFNSPFFSKNLSEFWRRWHISLGTWGKDYIMYPLLKSNIFQKIGKKCKKLFGKKIGKLIPTIISILLLWLFIGLWHGASYKYIFAAGILPWIYLTVGQIVEKSIEKLTNKLHIKTDCFSFRLFQSLRTFFFMCVIWLFACSPSLRESIHIIKNIFVNASIVLRNELPVIPILPILFSVTIVFIVDYLNYKNIDVSLKFKEQNLIFKFIVLFAFIITILIYGAYGPGYNPTDFIYGGF